MSTPKMSFLCISIVIVMSHRVVLRWCMRSLRAARTFKMAPPPSAFAEIVRRMGIVPSGAMLARWQEVATSAPPELPVARAKWLASLQPDVRSRFHVVLQEVFRELLWDGCLVRGNWNIRWYCDYYYYWCDLLRWQLVLLRVVVSNSCEAARLSAHVVLRVVVSSSWEAGRDSQHSLC